MVKVDEGIVEEIQACIPKKNRNQCMNKIFEEHGVGEADRYVILLKAVKRNEEADNDQKDK